MLESDSAGMLAHSHADDKHREVIAAVGSFRKAAVDFRSAFTAAYGQEAWQRFNSDEYSPGDSNASLRIFEGDIEVLLSEANLQVAGDEATYTVPNDPRPQRIVKTDAGWLVDVKGILPPGSEPEKFAELMSEMASAVTKYQRAIGKPGISADDIDLELGRATMKILSGMKSTKPPRFDIDKL